jgi:hypothetical protein
MEALTPKIFEQLKNMDPKKRKALFNRIFQLTKENRAKNIEKLITWKVIKPTDRKQFDYDFLSELISTVVDMHKNKQMYDNAIYITLEKKLIKNRTKYENIFNLRIRTPEEVLPIIQEEKEKLEKKKVDSYIG